MNKRVTIGLLLLITVVLVGIPGAEAQFEYASDLQAVYGVSACTTCHNPDFSRNTYGQLFNAQPHSRTNSAQNQAALRAIGAPPGVTPPDTTPPVITVNGANPVNINVGATYVDAGATATDNVDRVVTVVTSGAVNTAVAGAYTLTYNAKDTAGNAAIPKTRTVNVAATTPPSGRTYSVTFNVTNSITGKPIHDAKVLMDGITKKTNDYGKVKFTYVVSGIHSYKVSKEDYLTITGSIDVNKDTKVSVKLVKVNDEDDHEEEDDY